MKNKLLKKRALCLVLALIIAIGVPPAAFAAEPEDAQTESARLERLFVSTGFSDSDLEAALLADGENDLGVPVFDPEQTEYELTKHLYDYTNALRFWFTTEDEGTAVTVSWNGGEDSAVLCGEGDAGTVFYNRWANCLSAGRNELVVTVTPPEGSGKTEGEYRLYVNVYPTLRGLALSSEGQAVYLDGDFIYSETSYSADVSERVKVIDVEAIPSNDAYELRYNGLEDASVDVENADEISVAVSAGEVTTEYTVALRKVEAFDALITAQPEGSVIVAYDVRGAVLGTAEDALELSGVTGGSYAVTRYGYVSETGALEQGETAVALVPAPEPENALPSYDGDWTSFRGNPENMGVTDAKTATTYDETHLKWKTKLGGGWSSSPTPPLIIDGRLYTASGSTVYMLDSETGEILVASDPLEGSAGYALNPISYGEGMIFVPISGGSIQALRADTLESCWVSESLGGQSLTVAAYHDGYIYSGTWNSETAEGSYFALSVTDEDPSNGTEVKPCSWRLDHKGGFYWAGAYAADNYLIFGSDNGTGGEDGNGVLYSVNPKTGDVIDTIDGVSGDIRSTVAYDEASGAVYCSTKGGLLIKATVGADGSFTGFKSADLGGMATGTPMVYAGKVFIGVCGESQFAEGGHYFKIVDADTMQVEQTVSGVPGYVQTSALLTSAYAAERGKVYVYTTYNYTPGGIFTLEYDLETGEANAYSMFAPQDELAQYCICSLVCDAQGVFYYKNDSGYMMAVERNSAFLTGLEADTGSGLEGFDSARSDYELVVPAGTDSVGFAFTAAQGAQVSVNGGEDARVALSNGVGRAEIAVSNDGDSRVYTVSIREAAADCALASLNVNEFNGYSGFFELTPEFGEAREYVCFGALGGGDMNNIWVEPSDANAEVAVYPVSGISEDTETDESGAIPVTASTAGHPRRAVYLTGDTGIVRIRVTAEDGVSFADYILVLTSLDKSDAAYAAGIALDKSELTLKTGESAVLTAELVKLGDGALDGADTVWRSGDASVAEVDASGRVTAIGEGETEITASVEGEIGVFSAACRVVVTGSSQGGGGQSGVRVSFRLIGAELSAEDVDIGRKTGVSEYRTWITTKHYTLSRGSSVYDLFVKALDSAGLRYIGAENNYVETVFAPSVLGGYELSEFTNGPRSGWMYSVNGVHVRNGLKEQQLHDGDEIIWHYVNDYAYEVEDWFDDGEHPALGDESTWVDWSAVPDVEPKTPEGGAQGGGGSVGGAGGSGKPSEGETPEDAPKGFGDISGHWAERQIRDICALGLMNGESADRFNPDGALSRAMLVTVLYRLEGSPAVSGGSGFADVDAQSWYGPAVCWASANGIVNGYGGGIFGGGDSVTREQLAAILQRYSVFKGFDVSETAALDRFEDLSEAADWALDALGWANAAGLIGGRSASVLAPRSGATRAETAVIMARYISLFDLVSA